MMTERRAWSFLTVDGGGRYGGNLGYDDDPSRTYRYDEDVANHLQVTVGDIAVIRSRTEVLGIAEIESVTEFLDQKERLRCPECSSANIRRRAKKYPEWGCKNRHYFDRPVLEVVPIRKYEAHYGTSFRACSSQLTISRVQDAVLRPSNQMSIKQIDLARIENSLESTADDLITRFAQKLSVPGEESFIGSEGPTSIIEERRRVLREISLRRGQARFRQRLMRRYGAACQVSRCSFTGLVEAAHLRPYSRSSDNRPQNGLLLRSDLHTLFDLGFLGVEPTSMKIFIHPATMPTGYGQFQGVDLYLNGTAGPDMYALAERWDFYRSQLNVEIT